MKRLLLLSLVLLWAGCSSESANSNNAGGNSPESGKPKVALIMKSLANEFFSTMAKGAEKYQAENPDQFDLVVNGIKDERDLGRQVAWWKR